jgi:hypothetical protein
MFQHEKETPRLLYLQPASYVVHNTSRLRFFVLNVARYRAHVVIVFALGSGFVGGFLTGVLLNVFCTSSASRASPASHIQLFVAPFTLLS